MNHQIAWCAKVTPAFKEKVLDICNGFNWPLPQMANYLMACMAFETGRKFRADTHGMSSSAIGLIQFMPITARNLGTTSLQLAAMDEVHQLEYVRKYFNPVAEKIKTLEDMYMAILWPAAVGKPNNHVIFHQPNNTYLANKGLDLNKDGSITKAEAAAKVRQQLMEGLKPENVG